MTKGLFTSPKRALMFVGLTMASVAMLVGSEDDQGALVQAAASFEEPDQRDFNDPMQRQLERSTGEDQYTSDSADDSGFYSDEELIDDASGFDPKPDSTDPIDLDPAEGDVYIIQDES